jgi:very-short-patch-repair endonuclease
MRDIIDFREHSSLFHILGNLQKNILKNRPTFKFDLFSELEYVFFIQYILIKKAFPAKNDYLKNLILRPQYKVGKYRIDFAIIKKNIKIAIELDGFAYHDKTKKQFISDRERQNHLVKKGFTVLRYTWDEVTNNCIGIYNDILNLVESVYGK